MDLRDYLDIFIGKNIESVIPSLLMVCHKPLTCYFDWIVYYFIIFLATAFFSSTLVKYCIITSDIEIFVAT